MRESAVAGQLGANGASSRSGPEWAPSGERHVDPRPAFSSPTPFLLAPPHAPPAPGAVPVMCVCPARGGGPEGRALVLLPAPLPGQ